MTKPLQEVGDVVGDEKGMTYQKLRKMSAPDERQAATDPLGSNSEIGRKLRQYYDELVSDEIPDRFSQLLKKLERQEQPQSASNED